MVNHIIYHGDVDGIFTASLYLKTLHKTRDYRLYPLMSYARGKVFNDLVKNLNIQKPDTLSIFDFEDHVDSDFWVDHHPNKMLGHKPVMNDETVYDPAAYSAFQLLFRYLVKTNNECVKNSILPGIVEMINMIDNADYPDVDFIFNNTSPIMIIRAYLERSVPNELAYNRIVEVLERVDFDLDEAIGMLNLNTEMIDEVRYSVIKAKRFMEIYDNKVSVIRQKKPYEFPRYSEVFIRPDVKYNIRVSNLAGEYKQLQVSFNKWYAEKNNVHIGRFLANLEYIKGGGHYNVGGGFIKMDDIDTFIDDFSKTVGAFEKSLPKKEESMEKFAVDKNDDKFEKKAQELVKTGAAKSIDEAREQVNQEEKEPHGSASIVNS